MKSIIFTICLFISSTFSPNENVDITIRNKFRNLGTVTAGTIIVEKYYLVNNTTKNIQILKINPECSCTNFSVSSYEIMPHDSVYIELTLDTTQKQGSQTIYTIVKTNSKVSMYKLALKVFVNSQN